QGGHALPFGGGGDGHQPPGGVAEVLVHPDAAHGAVGAQHTDGLHDVGAVIGDEGFAGGLHYAVIALVHLLAGEDPHGYIFHSQQQGHHLAHAAARQGGNAVGHIGAADLV